MNDLPPPSLPTSSKMSPLVIGLLLAVVALAAVTGTLLLTGNDPAPDTPAAAPAVPDSDDTEWGDGPVSFEAAFYASLEELGPEGKQVVCDMYFEEPNLVYGMFRADLPMDDVSSSEFRRLFERACS